MQESWNQSYWKEDDRASPDLMQPSLEIDMLKSVIAEVQQTQHAFQQSIMAENAKFQQNVVSMLGKLWEDAQRAPSTPVGTVVIDLSCSSTISDRGNGSLQSVSHYNESRKSFMIMSVSQTRNIDITTDQDERSFSHSSTTTQAKYDPSIVDVIQKKITKELQKITP